MAEKHNFMIEGASATVLAALFEDREKLKDKKILCIITSGSIDLDRFCQICTKEY